MDSKLQEMVDAVGASGDQLWCVRIASKNNGSIERWIVSPIVRDDKPVNATESITSALEAVMAEDQDAEVWDCWEHKTGDKIVWLCSLEKPSRHTGPHGRVFTIERPLHVDGNGAGRKRK